MIWVIGHKNPDTDSIVSAITYAHLKRKLGMDVKPGRLGEINPETKFALQKFGVEEPELVAYNEADKYILVDHNSKEQTINGLKEEQIVEILDHHKIDLQTSMPIYMHVEPIGSTATIIFKLFKQHNVEITREIAGLLLSGILSDTVVLKSATTTDEDKKAVEELAKIAGVDWMEYGIELKKKLADVSGLSAHEIITRDLKEFNFNGKKVMIGQVEQVDWSLLSRKQELLEELHKLDADLAALMITNIIEGDTVLLFVGNEQVIEKAFGKPHENEIILKGVMSRKKQVVPKLQKAYS